MFPAKRSPRAPIFVLALTLFLAAPAVAGAGWMGFRNDTSVTLVIQEASGKAGRPMKIFAHETVRDTPPGGGGARTFTIADASAPDRPLYTGKFACPAGDENVLFVLKSDGKGGLVIEAVRLPGGVSAKPPKR